LQNLKKKNITKEPKRKLKHYNVTATLCIGTTPWCVTSIIWHCTAPDAA